MAHNMSAKPQMCSLTKNVRLSFDGTRKKASTQNTTTKCILFSWSSINAPQHKHAQHAYTYIQTNKKKSNWFHKCARFPFIHPQ